MSRYRSPSAYRFPKTYRGTELVPAVPPPGFGTPCAARWVLPQPRGRTLHAPWMQATPLQHAVAAPFGAAAALASAHSLRFTRPEPRSGVIRAPWAQASQQLSSFVHAPWTTPAAQAAASAMPWGRASPAADTLHAPWRQAAAHDSGLGLRWGSAEPFERLATALWRQAAARGAMVALPWGPAGTRQNGFSNPYPVPPGPTDPGGQPITVPIRDAYIMIPTLSAVVLPARTPLQLLSCRIATDVDRYCWEFSAQVPFAELAAVTPVGRADLVEIEVSINGVVWVLVVEGVDDQRRFGLRTGTLRGRSRSALLDAPFAPLRTGVAEDARTAAQLGDEQLAGTGWTLVWDSVDWLLPGGTWSYQDVSAIQALGQLASAIGACIETSRTTLGLTVSPRYSVSPWAWGSASPYAILPANILLAQSSTWAGGPNSNGVYVTTGTGSGALVRIDGTGGELQAGQVVERLLVTADAQRERGRIELARASQVSNHSIVVPLFPPPAEPGLIPRGALLQITDPAEPGGSWRGQVIGVSIDAQRSGGADSVRQTLTLERHHRD